MGSRKEERLSARAASLLRETRTRYAHSQSAAIKHLRSVEPSEFNLYDRQKIGREILRRSDIGSGYDGMTAKIVHDYSLEVPIHSSDSISKEHERLPSSRQPIFFPHDKYLSGRKAYAEGVKEAKLAEEARLDGRSPEVRAERSINDFSIAIIRFREAHRENLALKAYEKAIEVADKAGLSSSSKRLRHEMESLKQKHSKGTLEHHIEGTTAAITLSFGLVLAATFLSSQASISGYAVNAATLSSSGGWMGITSLLFILLAIASYAFKKK